jgi:signal peptidase II
LSEADGTPTRAEAPAGGARGSRWSLLLGVAAVVLVADQLTKWWAVEELTTRSIDVVWTLRFHLIYNRGASFGLGGSYGSLIGVLVLGVVGLLLWQGRQSRSALGSVALGLVLGGAIGNLIDRAFRGDDGFLSGGVVDFVDLQWWPIFNVADAAVVVGALLLVLQVVRGGEPAS